MMENVAFRGFSAVTPENTLTAFHRASQAGCHRISSELRLSADGGVFCFADSSMHRLTGSHGWFHRLSSFELRLRELPFGGQHRRVERIPRLEDLLNFAVSEKLGLQLSVPVGSSPRWRPIIESTAMAILEVLKKWEGKLDLQLCSADRRMVKALLEQSSWSVGAEVSRFADGMSFLDEPKLAFLRAGCELFIPSRRRRKGGVFLKGGLSLLKACHENEGLFYLGPVGKRAEMELFTNLDLDGILTPATAQLSSMGYRKES